MTGKKHGNAQKKVRVCTNFCTWGANKKSPVLSKTGLFLYENTHEPAEPGVQRVIKIQI